MNGCDELRAAVAAAEEGARLWRHVVAAQRPETPDHTDFYALACEVVATLRALESLAGVLGRQVADYGQGRMLGDDEGRDPGQRLVESVAHLIELGQLLGRAERSANRFWSAVGHIAVEQS